MYIKDTFRSQFSQRKTKRIIGKSVRVSISDDNVHFKGKRTHSWKHNMMHQTTTE